MRKVITGFVGGLLFVATAAIAQDVAVYTDGVLNSFDTVNSYGGGYDFNNPTPFHNGAPSIAFTGNASCNAISFYHTAGAYAAANYTLRFFVHGGATGGQSLYLYLQINGGTGILAAPVQINPYIAGNTIPANAWAQVDVPLGNLTFNANGSNFDRIDLANDDCTAQQPLYIDDVSLVATAAATQNYVFGDSFEPEYMLVPQYTTGNIKVYQRVINPGANPQFTLIHTAALGAGVKPNAVAFAPDGHLWVVDDGGNPNHLLRYTLATMLADANPIPSVVVGLSSGPTEVFDMAFFGDYAYVSQGFNSANAVLKFALSDLGTSGFTVPVATLTNADLNPPVGFAFDPQGRLWISTYDHNKIVRMDNTSTGHIDRIGTTVATAGGNSLNNVEGLAFDQYGTLWAANNGEFTVSAYTDAQLNNAGFGATTPLYQIVTPTANQHPGPDPVTGEAGGTAFDKNGSLWINFEYSWSVLEYSLASAHAQPGAGDYSTTPLPTLSSSTTDPGFGGIAFWPVPSTIHR